MLSRQTIIEKRFKVVAVAMNGKCPAISFLTSIDPNFTGARDALFAILAQVAEDGLDGVPSNWSHQVNKEHGIFEFRKGRLRLFYFKGRRGEIAVCTGGLIKKTDKVEVSAVQAAIQMKSAYMAVVPK